MNTHECSYVIMYVNIPHTYVGVVRIYERTYTCPYPSASSSSIILPFFIIALNVHMLVSFAANKTTLIHTYVHTYIQKFVHILCTYIRTYVRMLELGGIPVFVVIHGM